LVRIGLPPRTDTNPPPQQNGSDGTAPDMQDQSPEGPINTEETLVVPASDERTDEIPEPNHVDRTDLTSFPKYTHKEHDGEDKPEIFLDTKLREDTPSGELFSIPENPQDRYASIKQKLKTDDIRFQEMESIENTVLILRKDGMKILATYTEKCEIQDVIALEKNVTNNDVNLGLMISMEFSYDSKLFVVGRDLDLMKIGVLLRDGLVVEPSWFY